MVWREGYFGGSDIAPAAALALAPLRAETRTDFVGWEIAAWDSSDEFRATFESGRGRAVGLSVRRGVRRWTARRV